MKQFSYKILLLGGILCIAAFFRFYALDMVPPSPSLDEVSIGYNAYSLLETGKDEYGYSFPLLLRAYDDWRPGLYVYFVMPFIPLVGVSAVAVRLPSVLMSLATVVATYYLAKELVFHKKNTKVSRVNPDMVGMTAAFLLAISPWHVYISRLGHEANLGLTASVLSLLFFLKAMHNLRHKYFLFVAAGFFVLSLYGYQSQKLIIPVLLFSFACIYWRELLSIWQRVVIVCLLSGVLLLPLLVVSLSPEGLFRLKGTSAFSSDNPLYQESAINVMKAKEHGDIVGQVIHNRRLVNVKIFFNNYIPHFSPEWLFTNPNNGSHKVPNIGLLYLWEVPFLFVGAFVFYRFPIPRKTKLFFIIWFFSSPLPAAITTGSPHAMRSYTFLPAWQILSAIGITYIFYALRFTTARMVFSSIVTLVIGASVILLYRNYFIVFPKTQSSSFQYALGKSIQYVQQQQNGYDRIVFANNDNLHQSYMFFLFYTRYDPRKYQQQGGTTSGGYAQWHAFDKYEFRPIENLEKDGKRKTLVIGNVENFPDTIQIEKTFFHRNGKPAIVAGTL